VVTACIRISGFSAKSKVSAFNKSQYRTESEVLLNPLLVIHATRYAARVIMYPPPRLYNHLVEGHTGNNDLDFIWEYILDSTVTQHVSSYFLNCCCQPF
jgi:hypothetical protein